METRSLEDEKRLVATRLMGWEYEPEDYNGVVEFSSSVEDWNPQDNERATNEEWQEIWDKMDEFQWGEYIEQLSEFQTKPGKWKFLHTAKPEICWAALIKTISEE